MLNSEIVEKLKILSINRDDALIYLLSLYYGLKPTIIPEIIQKQVNMSGILVRDYEKGTVTWTVPLFTDKPSPEYVDPNWEWVITEYRKLFMDIRKDRGGDRASCIKKMQSFFADNPHIRKEDVMKATKLYLESFRKGTEDTKYLVYADYFIIKGKKGTVDAKSRLTENLEILGLLKKSNEKYMRNVT